MPMMRVYADGQLSPASPGSFDVDGIQVFPAGGGDTVFCTMDYTAFAGRDATVSGVAWTVTGATLGTTGLASNIATALITVPNVTLPSIPDPSVPQPITAKTTATMSDGRVLNLDFRLIAHPR